MRIVKRINEHLHGPDMGKDTCLVTKAGLKCKAEQSQDTSQHIVAESVQNIPEATATKLSKLNTLKRTIQRQLAKANLAPVQPENLAHLEIPIEYQRTSKNENFLLHDSGFEERRNLIFGTKTNTEMLELAPIWLADGTFKTAPILFEQVYVIHALRGGPEPFENGHLCQSICIVTKKTQDMYMRMWEVIQQLCPGAQPTHMSMDFRELSVSQFGSNKIEDLYR